MRGLENTSKKSSSAQRGCACEELVAQEVKQKFKGHVLQRRLRTAEAELDLIVDWPGRGRRIIEVKSWDSKKWGEQPLKKRQAQRLYMALQAQMAMDSQISGLDLAFVDYSGKVSWFLDGLVDVLVD